MTEHPVLLLVYDLSRGYIKQISSYITRKPVEAIWHTSIIVHGREVSFGTGICTNIPGESHLGPPVQIIELGYTRVDEELFDEFLRETGKHYTKENYHLLDFNCNTFSNLCANFLTGHSIPEVIQDLPVDFQSATIGRIIAPIIQAIYRPVDPNGEGNAGKASYASTLRSAATKVLGWSS